MLSPSGASGAQLLGHFSQFFLIIFHNFTYELTPLVICLNRVRNQPLGLRIVIAAALLRGLRIVRPLSMSF
jgi:hypothetical protein